MLARGNRSRGENDKSRWRTTSTSGKTSFRRDVRFMSFSGTMLGIMLPRLRMGKQGGRRSCNQRTQPKHLEKYIAFTIALTTPVQLIGNLLIMVASLHQSMFKCRALQSLLPQSRGLLVHTLHLPRQTCLSKQFQKKKHRRRRFLRRRFLRRPRRRWMMDLLSQCSTKLSHKLRHHRVPNQMC